MSISKIHNAMIYIKNAHNKRDDNIWAFGEWFGKKCNDNACYFANYVRRTHPEIKMFWICEENTDTSLLDSGIEVLHNNSHRAIDVLEKAGVAVMVQGINDFFSDGRNYLGNALKVNLWHGVMWKRLGYDIGAGASSAIKVKARLKNSFNRHYMFVAPNKEYRRIIKKAFLINDKEIIDAGYPRNSIFYDQANVQLCRTKIHNILGLSDSNTKILTYMPTFRDKTDDIFSFAKLLSPREVKNKASADRLKCILEAHNAVIVEKSHFVSSQRDGVEEGTGYKNENSRIRFLNDIGASELLAASDILITDYSSCFFDYLILDRPIIHYIYDYDYYVNNDRGVYYRKEDVACGKCTETVDGLLEAIEMYLDNSEIDRDLRLHQKIRFWEYDTPETCERIYQEIRRKQQKG